MFQVPAETFKTAKMQAAAVYKNEKNRTTIGLCNTNQNAKRSWKTGRMLNPYPTAFPYGNGMVLHFYQQQESSTTKTVNKVINKRLKTYV